MSRSSMASMLLGLCLAGCKSQGPPLDPLFAGQKPQESKAEQSAPVALAFCEPEAPSDPVALARSARPRIAPEDRQRGNVPGILTNRSALDKQGSESPP